MCPRSLAGLGCVRSNENVPDRANGHPATLIVRSVMDAENEGERLFDSAHRVGCQDAQSLQ